MSCRMPPVRAFRFFSSLRDEDARAWLLTIVRHAWYARLSVATGGANGVNGVRRDG